MSLQSLSQQPIMGMQTIRPSQFDPSKSLPTLPSLTSNINGQKRKRSLSKSDSGVKPTKVIKKSASTPSLSKSESAAASDEKKRNKLGYHRTSVACGHCRRRKIRCMMPDDDPSGRCSNCIRLKKECNFFPVDANMTGKGPHPPQRGTSVPSHARPGHSPSPMVFNQVGAEQFTTFGGHTSFSVPPPDTNLALFGGSAAPAFDASYSSSYDTPATTWESSTYSTLPTLGAPEASPYAYGMTHRQFESPLSVSPVPQYSRQTSTFRPSPFPDSAYASASKTPSNEISWAPPPPPAQSAGAAASTYRHFSPPLDSIHDSGRHSEQPPSLILSSETATTPTLSEATTIGSTSASAPGFWNPYVPADPLESVKPFSEPFDTTGAWFSEPLNGY